MGTNGSHTQETGTASKRTNRAGRPATRSLPVWEAGTSTPPVSDPFASWIGAQGASRRSDNTARYAEIERGCLPMARITRIASALAALAAIFLVAGAGSKY